MDVTRIRKEDAYRALVGSFLTNRSPESRRWATAARGAVRASTDPAAPPLPPPSWPPSHSSAHAPQAPALAWHHPTHRIQTSTRVQSSHAIYIVHIPRRKWLIYHFAHPHDLPPSLGCSSSSLAACRQPNLEIPARAAHATLYLWSGESSLWCWRWRQWHCGLLWHWLDDPAPLPQRWRAAL